MLNCTNILCKKEWDYTGSNKIYAICPDCRRAVKITSEASI